VKIAIGIGELSGDIFAANLIKYIRENYPNIEIIGITGPNSYKQGLASKFNISSLSVRGFFDVIFNLQSILKFRNNFLNFLLNEKPDMYLGIDAPDFNFFIERKLKKKGIKTFHMVCPSVWAWRANRVKSFNKTFDHLFTIFDHENKFLKLHKFKNFSYVGHPLAKDIPILPDVNQSKKRLNITHKGKIIGLLPGSRPSEVAWNTDVLIKASFLLSKKYKNLLFLVPITSKNNLNLIQNKLFETKIKNIRLVHGHSHDILNISDVAIIASGTATLEAVFFKTPMVVYYKLSSLSHFLFKFLLKSKYISLPNILSNKSLVSELIHKQATPQNITFEVSKLIDDLSHCKVLIKEFKDIHKRHRFNTNEIICNKLFQ